MSTWLANDVLKYNINLYNFVGFDVCPALKPAKYDTHFNVDISFAVQQYPYATNDIDCVIKGKGFELVKDELG